MTVEIKKPETTRDIKKASTETVNALVKAMKQNYVSAAVSASNALFEWAGKLEKSAGSQAWLWLQETCLRAMLATLTNPRLRSPLNDAELKKSIAPLVHAMLEDASKGTLTQSILHVPANLPAVMALAKKIPALARSISPEHSYSDEEVRTFFDSALRQEGGRLLVERPDHYGLLSEAVFGHIGSADDRSYARLRHKTWILNQYILAPIFSPDETIDIPLSKVYLRLRCFWHTFEDSEDEAQDEVKSIKIAHLADLHKTANAWLEGAAWRDPLRIVAGGPGSGKSSFARAFAYEVSNSDTHHVVFIPLQRLSLMTDLYSSIGRYLQREDDSHNPAGSGGLPGNPLDWRKDDPKPLLLIFDGLDELSANDQEAGEITKRFVSMVSQLLTRESSESKPTRAMVLGRTVACEDAVKEIGLNIANLIHVAPMMPITHNSVGLDSLYNDGNDARLKDPCELRTHDQRKSYWANWCAISGGDANVIPQAVTAKQIAELNHEPLLLHLLIISDYCHDKWEEAAKNRNLVYQDIFKKIFKRNLTKGDPETQQLSYADFMTLMECLGLAAWRGNGRTGSDANFLAIRKMHASNEKKFTNLSAANLKSVAMQIHTRRDTNLGEGFEFIHKSFGEYLAGRAILSAIARFSRLMDRDDEPEDVETFADRWSKLFAEAVPSASVFRFLRDEARLIVDVDQLNRDVANVTELFNWVQKHGLPVHLLKNSENYRTLEHLQKQGEVNLLVGLNALSEKMAVHHPKFAINNVWFPVIFGAARCLARNGNPMPNSTKQLFSHFGFQNQIFRNLDLSEFNLRSANLGGANLRGASLEHASLEDANLDRANLKGASLGRANLDRANLRSANLRSANLERANLDRANLMHASLEDANLERANLRSANLEHASLEDANLMQAYLEDVNLERASLGRANLEGANLDRANLEGANLEGANLERAHISGSTKIILAPKSINLQDGNFSGASCRFMDFSNQNMANLKYFENSFGDGSVILPDGYPRPKHWAEKTLEDEEFFGHWKGWLEFGNRDANHWLTANISGIAPPERSIWIPEDRISGPSS